ncbi:hypothetical protein ASO20_02805 [Mycoplasma sp. (ex Biomphalaria glabrata)]|uniref:hypothetical protein n=1 Tax=Mycoplasma sp. (ex Biomphalaria glabrata) TaxID=1749074 RepID=UPI00073A5B08|nr:hypothetical protein [Mycoplasma sp. (ex Biomphalaria glabrata)]ALV23563.1 hypothetical protein ASO20_02805 [Mycoplasma sp. (ex Biomphalaria glabrata)]
MSKNYSVYSVVFTFSQMRVLKKLVKTSSIFKDSIEKLISIQYAIEENVNTAEGLAQIEKIADLYCSKTGSNLEILEIDPSELTQNNIDTLMNSLKVFTYNLLKISVDYLTIENEEQFNIQYETSLQAIQDEPIEPNKLQNPTTSESVQPSMSQQSVVDLREKIKNFNPFDNVWKHIIRVKKSIGWLYIAFILTGFLFQGFLIAYYSCLHVQAKDQSNNWVTPTVWQWIEMLLISQVLWAVAIKGVISWIYLKKPKTVKEKFEFSLLWGGLSIIYVAFVIFDSASTMNSLLYPSTGQTAPLIRTNLTNILEICSLISLIMGWVVGGIIVILSIIGIVNRPKINQEKFQKFINEQSHLAQMNQVSNQSNEQGTFNRNMPDKNDDESTSNVENNPESVNNE